MSGSERISAVVFDLGGVLAEFGGVAPMRRLTGIDSDESLWERWLECEAVRHFERGTTSPEEFASGMVAEWQLPITPEDFLRDFRGWLAGPFEGSAELVEDVGARATVACLSNTNRVHWELSASQWPLFGLFDHTFLSFELGLVKPDREIFERVAADLGGPADQVLVLDDNRLNVDAAKAVGLRAMRVAGVDEARSALVAAGVLPSPTGDGKGSR